MRISLLPLYYPSPPLTFNTWPSRGSHFLRKSSGDLGAAARALSISPRGRAPGPRPLRPTYFFFGFKRVPDALAHAGGCGAARVAGTGRQGTGADTAGLAAGAAPWGRGRARPALLAPRGAEGGTERPPAVCAGRNAPCPRHSSNLASPFLLCLLVCPLLPKNRAAKQTCVFRARRVPMVTKRGAQCHCVPLCCSKSSTQAQVPIMVCSTAQAPITQYPSDKIHQGQAEGESRWLLYIGLSPSLLAPGKQQEEGEAAFPPCPAVRDRRGRAPSAQLLLRGSSCGNQAAASLRKKSWQHFTLRTFRSSNSHANSQTLESKTVFILFLSTTAEKPLCIWEDYELCLFVATHKATGWSFLETGDKSHQALGQQFISEPFPRLQQLVLLPFDLLSHQLLPNFLLWSISL